MSDDLHSSRQHLRERSFAAFGIDWLCYVKPVVKRGRIEYRIHGADGTYLWCYPDRAIANAALCQHEMQALSVH